MELTQGMISRRFFWLGKGCGSQGHVLLILTLEEADAVPALGQGLAYAHHATVAKHAEDIVDKFIGNAIHFHILPVQKADQRLSHGQAYPLGLIATFTHACRPPNTEYRAPAPTDAP